LPRYVWSVTVVPSGVRSVKAPPIVTASAATPGQTDRSMRAPSMRPTISRDRFGTITLNVQGATSRAPRDGPAYNGSPSIGLVNFAYGRPRISYFSGLEIRDSMNSVWVVPQGRLAEMSPNRAGTARRPSRAAFTRGTGARVQPERLPPPAGNNQFSPGDPARRASAAGDVRWSVHQLLGHDRRTMRSARFVISAPRALVALAMSGGIVVLSADRSAAGERDRGAQLAAICASCHRLDGRDQGIPSIIGLDEATLVAEMRAFKSGERPGQIMRVMSLSLTADDFAAVARYLAAQRKDTNPR
jgi:cytochrome subunit of sulfide dehydrogenase